MSYFIFGLIDVRGPLDAENVQAAAAAEGMDVKIGNDMGQGILAEMRGPYSPAESTPFLLTREKEDDTSHDLVSAYDANVRERFEAIGRWVATVLSLPKVEAVQVWMTEGYDSSFENVELTAAQFGEAIASRVEKARDIPSLRVVVAK